jgi:hypothetical protein
MFRFSYYREIAQKTEGQIVYWIEVDEIGYSKQYSIESSVDVWF